MKHPSAGAPSTSLVAALTRPRPWLMVLAQFFPVIALSIGYPVVERALSVARFEGVPFTVLIVSCAVITPTLAQAVAAPVYLALLRVDVKDPAAVCAAAIRSTPRATLIVVPLLVLAVVPVALARQLTPASVAIFSGLLLLHVLMGALMVPAYALRAPVLLIIGWTAYLAALLTVPTLLWMPPAVAIVAEAVVVLLVARRRAGTESPSGRASSVGAAFVAALRGAAEGLPLWSIPVVLWLVDVRLASIGFVYAALLPAVLAHQLFFVQVVDPAWKQLDGARETLQHQPYDQARAAFERFATHIGSGVARAAGLLVVLSLTLVAASVSLHWDQAPLLVLIVVTAFAAVMAMMQGYTIAMVGSSVPLALLGGAALTVLVVGVAARLPDEVVLAVAASVYLIGAAVMVPVRRAVMRQPEYRIFWRSALAQ